MSDTQILLVDDQAEVRKMLRSTLEVAIGDLDVVDVPSAEEAMLEVQRTEFDLVIIDLHLPGMNGVELMSKVRAARPDANLIVVTGNIDAAKSPEIISAAPKAVFVKPLNPSKFIETVQEVLGRTPREIEQPEVQPGVNERVLELRSDLGAVAVYLADDEGHIVVRAGDVPDLDVAGMLLHIESAFNAGFRVSTMLGGYVPLNMLFFDGDEYDVYVANVGKSFMLLMIFQGERAAQQMGSSLHYGRQAADDLLNLLAQMGIPQTGELKLPAEQDDRQAAQEPEPEERETPTWEPEEKPEVEPIELDFEVLEEASEITQKMNVKAFWTEALEESNIEEIESNALSYEQALKLGLVSPEDD